ncbi:DUF2255 family protein [Actinoplanes sp. TRM 88003]|uniref:DUF2255 family protein n=1 Tax=Paractinoplanes aksuensis TaxID=2939490 RepID=A0ABT1DDZ0_9ACTN|nr:DUF2255 family protein [Actinoplanes aksuensis]MCO8269028.1 DUF2255 family protein [Actinoplanes aksuensis]
MTGWAPDALRLIEAADELEIAPERTDGTLRRWVPIWVVSVGDQAFVRTWHRRETGWFGHVLKSRRAGIRVPGLQTTVLVDDVGAGPDNLRAAIDAAYHAKYGRYGSTSIEQMVNSSAAATTLRLSPADSVGATE